MLNVQKHLALLGHRVKDKVTGFEGVISSISFDLYGCIQAIVSPAGLDKDGKIAESHWFDVGRLIVLTEEPIMDPPNYFFGEEEAEKPVLQETIVKGMKGPADKPATRY